MRVSQVRKLMICGSLLLLLLAVSASAWAQATLGRGLEQMVELYEFGNPKLADVMKLQLTSPAGNVLVHIRLAPGATVDQVLPQLTLSGFQLQAISLMDPSLVEGYLPLESARTAAGTAGVKSILAVQRPVAHAGSVQSQAVAVEKADLAQARGIDGTGTKLGAMSDSYDTCTTCSTHAAQDVSTGDLPTGVVVLEDFTGGTDEGRAMLQLVHDIAPGSALAFATAFVGEVDFSNNMLKLRRNFHADVEVDDITYFDEPMYSDGLLAQTVDEVVKEGGVYFASAFNNGLEGYEADYSSVSFEHARRLVAEGKSNLDLDALAAFNTANGLPLPVSLHNFNAPHFTVSHPEGRDGHDCRWGHHHEDVAISQGYISYFGDIGDFQWAEPFFQGKVETIYFVYIFDANGAFENPLTSPNVFYTLDNSIADDEAIQLWEVNPGSYQIVIAKMNHGPARRFKYVDINGTGESERQDAPTTWGHPAAKHGQGVAAMYYPITNFPEDFSSPGPVTILFDKYGNRLHEPEIRFTPQITAIDGVDTTFFGSDTDGNGHPNFFGTSAAAPDAAAVGALVIQSAGGPGSLRAHEVYDRLQDTATPVRLSKDRALAFTKAGPVDASANGDFARQTDYWRLKVDEHTSHTVSSVSINLTVPNMHWSNPASATTGFHVGKAKGLLPTDVSASRSTDLTTLTLTFKPGTFGAGDELTFANFIFAAILPFQFPFDADRVRGGVVTVTLDDGSTATGSFHVEKRITPNHFTGAGLVNADLATRPRHHDHDGDDH